MKKIIDFGKVSYFNTKTKKSKIKKCKCGRSLRFGNIVENGKGAFEYCKKCDSKKYLWR